MTSSEILPLAALAAMFILATIFPINIGFLGFAGAFLLGFFVLGLDDKAILESMPVHIVLTIIGVTYFFGMAKQNGTIDLLVNACIRGVRGRTGVMPWIFFVIASALTALGTFSPAAVALLAPAAMTLAHRAGISALVMGILVINGAHAGAFSPLSVSGVLVTEIVRDNGMALDPWGLFLASYGINLLLSVLTVAVDVARRRIRRTVVPVVAVERVAVALGAGGGSGSVLEHEAGRSPLGLSAAGSEVEAFRPDARQRLTLFLIAAILFLVLVLQLPISFTALSAGIVLAFTALGDQAKAIGGISWSTVILVAGMMTYVAMLEKLGVIDSLASAAVSLGAPMLVALLLCYVIGVSSAFASSTALLAAMVPMAMPLLETSDLSVLGLVAALAISATVVDVSPFSTNGALILANVQGVDKRVFYRRVLANSAVVVAVAPLLCWAILVGVPSLL